MGIREGQMEEGRASGRKGGRVAGREGDGEEGRACMRKGGRA